MRRTAWLAWLVALGIQPLAHAESFEPDRLHVASDAPTALPVDDIDPDWSTQLHGALAVRTFYRSEDMAWSINAGAIDIRSELEWERVRSVGTSLEGRIELPHALEVRGVLEYGRIVAGEIRDSDYNGPNRTLEFSRSISQTERGSVWDFRVGLGWVRPLGTRVVLTPRLGLSYHQQNYNIRDGKQLIGMASLAGLDSDFDSEWYGFFWGADVRVHLTERWDALVGFASHHTAYRAEAHFNLRSDLGDPSFTHTTIAEGSTFHAGLQYALGGAWTFELLGRYRDWESDSGRTKFLLSAGGASRQRFNEIDFESLNLSAGLVYAF